jgi:glycosyltransferase involved in cell wall biosynthesis
MGTAEIPRSKLPHLKVVGRFLDQSALLRSRIKWCGELPDRDYRSQLRSAEFLFHAAVVDNGTFSVVEAAQLGVPSLSSDYPAMREINQNFSLGLTWMDGRSSRHMAMKLKEMEASCRALRVGLPAPQKFRNNSVATHALRYWQEVEACL